MRQSRVYGVVNDARADQSGGRVVIFSCGDETKKRYVRLTDRTVLFTTKTTGWGGTRGAPLAGLAAGWRTRGRR